MSGLSNQKIFELSLHSEIRTFHIVNDSLIFFATARGLFRISMANIEIAKPEKIGGSAGNTSSSSSSIPVNDLLPWEAAGEHYVIASFRDGSVRVYHAMTGELKHSVPSAPDCKMVQKITLLGSGTSQRLLCAHLDGKMSALELPSFKRVAVWQAFEKTNTSVVVAVPQVIASRLGCDVRGLFLVGSQNGGLQLWQHAVEDEDDDL